MNAKLQTYSRVGSGRPDVRAPAAARPSAEATPHPPPSKKKVVAYRGILFAPLDLVAEKLP
jgi:hypothetical protein